MRSPRNVRPLHKTWLERGLVQPRATELTEGALWGPWAPLSPFSTLLQQLIGVKMTRCKDPPPICRFNDMYWKPHTLGMTHGCSPSLEGSSKFQTSQGYIERPCLKKKKERQKKGRKDGWEWVQRERQRWRGRKEKMMKRKPDLRVFVLSGCPEVRATR